MAANDGRFDDAERFFQIVLNDNHDSASAWSNLGNVHLSLGRPKDASQEFSKAIALAPQVQLGLELVGILSRDWDVSVPWLLQALLMLWLASV